MKTATKFNAMPAAQSVRGVGCKKGWPYFATGLYRMRYTTAGRLVWQLERSGNWCRSRRIETAGKLEESAPVLSGIRHNKPVTAEQLKAIKAASE